MAATRWAICGAGQIAHDFCMCINSLPTSEHQVVAIAAKDTTRAAEFAAKFDIPYSYGSYDELVNAPDIDIVYIATIHPYHVETSLTYIAAGMNVLCEKPMSLSLEGCRKVIAAAKEKGVLFVEGTWSRFFPVYRYLMDEVKARGLIGDIKMVEASFCGNKLDSHRLAKWKLGGGGLTDLGGFGVQFATLFFDGTPSVKAEATYTDSGQDKAGVILLKFPGNQLACMSYSAETESGANSAVVRGTKGNVVIPDFFWCPEELYINGEHKRFPLPEVKDKDKFNWGHSEGMIYEIQCMRECLLKGLKECPIMSHAVSIANMEIIQEVLNQIGVKYDAL